jgi:hypothetical protein
VTTPVISVHVDGDRLEGRVLDLLSRLEIRESDMDPTIATLRFRLIQRPTGAFSPIDDEIFTACVPLAVELGAPGGLPIRLFEGYATHVRPHFESIEANCYLEVIAMDAAVILDAEERVASYPDATDADAVREVLGRYQISAAADDTPAQHKADHHLLMQRETDWQFVQRLARRNGFSAYFEFDEAQGAVVAHFERPKIDAEAQADLTILRAEANLGWIDLQLSARGPARHRGAAIDPIFKRLVRSDGEGELEALGSDGLDGEIESGLTAAGAESATAMLRDPVPGDAAINSEGTGLTDLDRFAVEARGQLDPALYRGILRCRRPVLIKGIGERFSGTYFVRSVLTLVEEGALTQTFVALRNALGQSGQEDFGQSAEEVPPE